MKNNIFLNKKLLIRWNKNKTAFAVQSPINPLAVIWWNWKWYLPSKFNCNNNLTIKMKFVCLDSENKNNHMDCPGVSFGVGIIFNDDYKQIIYDDLGIKQIIPIKGEQLYENYKSKNIANSAFYLQQADKIKSILSVKTDAWTFESNKLNQTKLVN